MSNLQMIRADISVRDFQRWMGSRRLQDADHAMHCLLTECFGELAPKPFRAMFPRGGAKGTLYGYADVEADALRDAAGTFACPLQAQAIPAGSLDSKPMPAEWAAGKRLGFEVRIRPTRRLRRPLSEGGKLHIAERDAFLMQALDDAKATCSREEVYREWLRERLQKCGAAGLNTANLQSFQRTRSYRKRNAPRHIEGPDALMRGVLTVDDGAAFAKLLTEGIGRHRAYGYGMLLLRPAGSPVRQ